jgi:hypothetical protein
MTYAESLNHLLSLERFLFALTKLDKTRLVERLEVGHRHTKREASGEHAGVQTAI